MSINTFLGVPPIAQQPYQMAPTELNELKTELQELFSKGFYGLVLLLRDRRFYS
jgi:hypothetical protein